MAGDDEQPQTQIEAISKTKATYGSILLNAINDARRALARDYKYSSAINALISILTPEVLGAARPRLSELERGFDAEISRFKRSHQQKCICGDEDYIGTCEKYRDGYMVRWKTYQRNRLSVIVEVLDDHGLLRDVRREEVGRL